ncbi:MAG: nitroreductase family protein [Methanoregula sp.]
MCTITSDQKNAILDEILATRRSHRLFLPDVPPEDDIRRILHAGLLAPFAAAAVGGTKDYFRRFFVIRLGSPSMAAASECAMTRVRTMSDDLDRAMEKNPRLRAQAVMFVQRLSMMKTKGMVPGIGTAPYYIVVAERRGFPPVELQSLAHCLENMWLKATALDLGFQIVSVTSEMSDDPGFCAILGIPPGEWMLMGCAIGYPKDELSPSIRPPVEDVTHWL